jgi:hypothetical protein
VSVAIIATQGTFSSAALSSERSGYPRAAAFVQSRDGGLALSGSEVVVFYLRGNGLHCTVPRLPFRRRLLESAISQGYVYAIMDRSRASSQDPYVRRHARLVARFPAIGPITLGENLISSENSDPPRAGELPDYVDVYNLTGLPHGTPSRTTAPFICNRDIPN